MVYTDDRSSGTYCAPCSHRHRRWVIRKLSGRSARWSVSRRPPGRPVVAMPESEHQLLAGALAAQPRPAPSAIRWP